MPGHSRFFRIRFGLAILLSIGLIVPASGVILVDALAAVGSPGQGAEASRNQQADPVVFVSTADSFVLKDQPSANNGSFNEMQVDMVPHAEAYLRFDVNGLVDPVESATLRLWARDDTDMAPTVWMSRNTTWSESELTWNTRPALEAVVSVGVDPIKAESWWEVDVSGLVRGNGTYTIALVANSGDGVEFNSREAGGDQPQLLIQPGEYTPPGEFVPPVAASDETPVLLAAGDIATCNFTEDELTARILDRNDGTVAALGDNVQGDGAPEEYEDCYEPTWGRHKDRTMPVPGNHDYETEGAEPYYEYWGDLAGEAGDGWYTYEIGEWQIFALNSNLDQVDHDKQYDWLREELDASTAACTLAYWHHPRFSSSVRHGNNDWIEPFWDMLYENGAEIVLNGHDHVYERFAPQDPDQEGDPEFGIRQFTVATGGAPQRDFAATQPNSQVRMTGVHGVLRLELQPDGYRWEFLSVDGQVFSDTGAGECHGKPGSDDESTPENGHRPSTLIAVVPDRVVVLRKSGRIDASGNRAR